MSSRKLEQYTKEQLIGIIRNLEKRLYDKEPRKTIVVKEHKVQTHECTCCPNPDDHYHYIDGHEMGS